MYLDRSAGHDGGRLGTGVLNADHPPADPAALFADAGLERGADGGLRLDGVSLQAIGRDVGTPAYLYSAAAIRRRHAALAAAFAHLPHEIHYAVKANSNLAVLGLLRDLGVGADIVSGGELERVRRVGYPAGKIVFSGVGKTDDELEAAVRAGVAINLESSEELTALERVTARVPIADPVRLGIRVNPEVSADTHPYITTGGRGIKFGVPPEQVLDLARRIVANPRLTLTTVAMHLGSQLLDSGPFEHGTRVLLAIVDRLRGMGVRSISALDVGGGLGIRYRDETPLEPSSLAALLGPLVADRDLTLHLEPGRYLTASAGVLLARVLFRKRSGGREFVIVDASMTDLVRPSHYQAYHAIVEVTARQRGARAVDVVGPVCETGDFLALDRPLADVEPGEYLAVLCAGAYGAVMASNYNTRLRAPELIIDRGRYAVARRRETIDDLLAVETADPFKR